MLTVYITAVSVVDIFVKEKENISESCRQNKNHTDCRRVVELRANFLSFVRYFLTHALSITKYTTHEPFSRPVCTWAVETDRVTRPKSRQVGHYLSHPSAGC